MIAVTHLAYPEELLLEGLRMQLTRLEKANNIEKRSKGLDCPNDGAETMIGLARLKNISELAKYVAMENVPGDFVDCGTWRGGSGIYMAACLDLYFHRGFGEPLDRKLYVADSFDGCPAPNPERYPGDRGDKHHTFEHLKVTLAEVERAFAEYGMLDDRVQFLPGWFKDTLPGPIERIALLRLDGDLYESTIQCLEALYPLVSIGGYVICDDYLNLPACHQAIEEYRLQWNIKEKMHKVDWCAVWWRKERQEYMSGGDVLYAGGDDE